MHTGMSGSRPVPISPQIEPGYDHDCSRYKLAEPGGYKGACAVVCCCCTDLLSHAPSLSAFPSASDMNTLPAPPDDEGDRPYADTPYVFWVGLTVIGEPSDNASLCLLCVYF